MSLPILRPLLAIAAAAGPSLLAYNVAPSPTFWNQALALAGWGWFAVASAPAANGWRGTAPLIAALGVTALTVLCSWGFGSLPSTLALSALGLVAAAGVIVASGAAAHAGTDAAAIFDDVCLGLAVAGVLNVAIAVVQVFWPGLPDGDWIAHSGLPGRAVGNLRQPNHLSSLLVWSAVAVVALLERRRLGRRTAAPLLAAIVFAIVLSASRTGTVSVVLLGVWGLADRKLSRPARALLVAAPLVYALSWLGMAEWARLSAHTFGGEVRLGEADVSGSRYGIWRNTLALIAGSPWTGVGFGEFNLAWSLTPFPGRPVAFFDHTHNLPLQLAVETGLPLAALVLGLLGWALWRGLWRAGGGDGVAGCRRFALAMVVLILLHSMLEYPLWYAYFLLPTAWLWGFAVGEAASAPGRRARPAVLVAAAALVIVGAAASVLDYARVTPIFAASPGEAPLEQRIEAGRRSVLFGHHADYAAATTEIDLADDLAPFDRAVHYLLDTRLMMAWAKALEHHGRDDQARWIADRLREFRNPGADEFFDACTAAASAPFQCRPAARAHDWHEFVGR